MPGSISKTLFPIYLKMVIMWKKDFFEDTAMLIHSQELQAYDGIAVSEIICG